MEFSRQFLPNVFGRLRPPFPLGAYPLGLSLIVARISCSSATSRLRPCALFTWPASSCAAALASYFAISILTEAIARSRSGLETVAANGMTRRPDRWAPNWRGCLPFRRPPALVGGYSPCASYNASALSHRTSASCGQGMWLTDRRPHYRSRPVTGVTAAWPDTTVCAAKRAPGGGVVHMWEVVCDNGVQWSQPRQHGGGRD